MKAFKHDRYGSPDRLELREVDRPPLADDGVLVRVRATSVNAHDWHLLRGKPYIARLGDGLRRPKASALGIDVAGVVEAAGSAVTAIGPGDEVFGVRSGAFAEYVSGRNFIPKPASLTFEQAAAVPVAAQTALQAIRDKGQLQPGQRVLVNGAGGGVGTFAVQIAKALGGEVTAATRPANLEVVRSLGSDEVVDYTRDDVTRRGRLYDLILDAGGNHSLRRLGRALTPDGTIVLIAPAPGNWAGPIVRILGAVVRTRLGRPAVRPFLSWVSMDDLAFVRELIEAGSVRPVIDRTYPFKQVPEAIRYVESGAACGKVVITLGGEN